MTTIDTSTEAVERLLDGVTPGPCPFCRTSGSQPPYASVTAVNKRGSRYFTKCGTCGAEGSHEMTEAEASANALRRVVDLPHRIERLGGQNYAYVRVEEILALIPKESHDE